MIKYLIQGDSNPVGISVRLTIGSNIDRKARTIFSVNPKEWSKSKGGVLHKRSEELRTLHENLEELRSQLTKKVNEALLKNEIIDGLWLRNAVNPKRKIEKKPDSLLDYLAKYEAEVASIKSKSIKEKIRQANLKISRYEKYRQQSIGITEVSAQVLRDMHSYLINTEHYSEGTIVRFIKFVKTICFYAQMNGVAVNADIRQVRLSVPANEPIYLNKKELIKIKELKIEKKYLDNARDWLIISCFTAQRVSDLMRNRYEQLIKSESGTLFLVYRQKKTKKDVEVLLNRVVEEILEKNGNKFPRPISSVNYNKYIKEVCKLAGLTEMVQGKKAKSVSVRKIGNTNSRERVRKVSGLFPKYELISAHIGRRSFASNFMGVMPNYLIREFTGHSSDRELAKYVGRPVDSFRSEKEKYFFPERIEAKSVDSYWGF